MLCTALHLIVATVAVAALQGILAALDISGAPAVVAILVLAGVVAPQIGGETQ